MFFLKLKHWQLFLMTVGLYIATLPLVVILQQMADNTPKSAALSLTVFLISIIVMILNFVIPLIWLCSLIIVVQKEFRPKTSHFLVYTAALFCALGIFSTISPAFKIRLDPTLAGVIQMLSVVAWFYLIIFSTRFFYRKLFKRKPTFGEFVEYFVLVAFFPVGIWIIQPKVNKGIISSDS